MLRYLTPEQRADESLQDALALYVMRTWRARQGRPQMETRAEAYPLPF